MVIKGARTSLARARMIRSARRSRSSRVLSRSSSSSSRTSSSSLSKTQSTSTTKQTKQIAMYEEVQKAADGLQSTAKSLIELGTVAIATSTATTTTDATASTSTITQTNAKTEEELKKEIIIAVEDLVEQYNTIYNNLSDLSGTTNTIFSSQLKSLVGNCEEALKKTGVSVNKNGTLSITEKTLKNTDLSTLKEVYCKSSGIVGKLMDKCESIESNASSTINVLNRMYGTSTYNKYGSSSSYYGSSGSGYNAMG